MDGFNNEEGMPPPPDPNVLTFEDYFDFDAWEMSGGPPSERNTAPALPPRHIEPSSQLDEPIATSAQSYEANTALMFGDNSGPPQASQSVRRPPYGSTPLSQTGTPSAGDRAFGQSYPSSGAGSFEPAYSSSMSAAGPGYAGPAYYSQSAEPHGHQSGQYPFIPIDPRLSLTGAGQSSGSGGFGNLLPQSPAGSSPLPPVMQPAQSYQRPNQVYDWGITPDESQETYLSPPEMDAGTRQGPAQGPAQGLAQGSAQGSAQADSSTGRYKGFARSADHARKLYAQFLARGNTRGGSDRGFPRDDAGQCQLVRQAVEAMVQLEESDEAREVAAGTGRKNTAYSRIQERYWSDMALELMAWKVLEACKDAQEGKCRIPPWFFGDKRLSIRSEYDTFTDRWNAVIGLLRVSKKTVNALFDTSFVDRIGWNIDGELKRKQMNKQGNEKKGALLRNTKRPHAPEEDEEEDDQPHLRRK